METLHSHFCWNSWFADSLHGIALFFSNFGRCKRFISVCVESNSQISSRALKDSFRSMFEKTCPQLIETRWNFLFFTLSWLLERRAAFQYLALDLDTVTGCKELSASEARMLQKFASNGVWAKKFWLVAELAKGLCDWGISVSKFVHACPCHPKSGAPSDPSGARRFKQEREACRLKGRQGVWMAWGIWETFLEELDAVVPSKSAAKLVQELEETSETSEAGEGEAEGEDSAAAAKQFCSDMLVDFQACKASMAFKGKQAWSFWSHLPWAILKIAGFLWGVAEDDCRTAAAELMACYDQTDAKSCLGVPSFVFFSQNGRFRSDFVRWISGCCISKDLMRELFFYSLSLLSMQRLEAKHRYINIQVGRGRASSPGATMAELRRKANQDLQEAGFRQLFPELMSSFDTLVPGQWDSFQDLLRIVYGHGIAQMHPDIEAEENCMRIHLKAITDMKADTDKQVTPLLREHLATCLKQKFCYAVPLRGDSNIFRIFQLISLNPAQRSYIQRTSALSVDDLCII